MDNRENIEWCDIWVRDADKSDCKRVLLMGDSITRSYYPAVEEQITPLAACARVMTSKCVSDSTFTKELRLVLDDYSFNVIHFNNGLHGWDYSEDEYAQGLADLIQFFQDESPHSRLIWATTTPMREKGNLGALDAKTERVKVRNAAAVALCENNNIVTNDLFALTIHRPELFSEDAVHFNPEGKSTLAEQVTRTIRAHI
ncbi:MAG: SGNH/GDSL hydrolase family protein [Gemmatimonadetes bacterium]|jgi:lysophospholipase L1-like esterase|nr:SGNH/GDSL hydrolase family protein [Gemmatimonadota bacterium]MBT4613005.1 SGNH/GDSL hydrolase family protein [Gemmatimonadota bacterium]MBT5056691.1 SGNH/GDSL hydrolase family protein [Gemmatimonadota bacterium]MBT5145638.1 SGNH/GDSL hydrolase family protein [Gemmatimonadota bacterium]MBT5588132.1 SGNH/GDSL hydrolase family protein [Gemmatimonadota bacterium]